MWRHLTVFSVLVASAVAQDVRGAAATVTSLDRASNAGTIEVVNVSTKDITAYSLAIEAVRKNGHKERNERMKDYGYRLTSNGEALHPSATDTDRVGWSVLPDNPIVSTNVTVVAVVYADRTYEASDNEALTRISDHRKSMALTDSIVVEAIKTALTDALSDKPSAEAAGIVRGRIPLPRAQMVGPDYIDPALLKEAARELEQAPKIKLNAAEVKVSEREYLQERLAEMQQLVEDEKLYAQIRKQP